MAGVRWTCPECGTENEGNRVCNNDTCSPHVVSDAEWHRWERAADREARMPTTNSISTGAEHRLRDRVVVALICVLLTLTLVPGMAGIVLTVSQEQWKSLGPDCSPTEACDSFTIALRVRSD